ncbi:hypothetical protein [Streptomyces sp. Wb2n-11]|nr:hypothetical protein [Streptomyces sp. Wb2n-11]
MAGLAVLIPVIIPVLMLGVIVALGRYEEFILSAEAKDRDPVGRPVGS